MKLFGGLSLVDSQTFTALLCRHGWHAWVTLRLRTLHDGNTVRYRECRRCQRQQIREEVWL